MNFLILSDSHRNRQNVDLAISRAGKLDGIFFLGDGVSDLGFENNYNGIPLFRVMGNCDVCMSSVLEEIPEELFLTFGEYNILLMHGHTLGVKSSICAAAAYAAKKGADALLFGHTHMPYEKYLPAGEEIGGVTLQKPLYLFNPGSIGKLDAWHFSFGTLSLSKNGLLFAHGKL